MHLSSLGQVLGRRWNCSAPQRMKLEKSRSWINKEFILSLCMYEPKSSRILVKVTKNTVSYIYVLCIVFALYKYQVCYRTEYHIRGNGRGKPSRVHTWYGVGEPEAAFTSHSSPHPFLSLTGLRHLQGHTWPRRSSWPTWSPPVHPVSLPTLFAISVPQIKTANSLLNLGYLIQLLLKLNLWSLSCNSAPVCVDKLTQKFCPITNDFCSEWGFPLLSQTYELSTSLLGGDTTTTIPVILSINQSSLTSSFLYPSHPIGFLILLILHLGSHSFSPWMKPLWNSSRTTKKNL